uniref:Uncharacterized protein n=1 Tax=Cacopsylla melanoneura TaxID=428564 RepID=A0A8D8S7M0_9HEMI
MIGMFMRVPQLHVSKHYSFVFPYGGNCRMGTLQFFAEILVGFTVIQPHDNVSFLFSRKLFPLTYSFSVTTHETHKQGKRPHQLRKTPLSKHCNCKLLSTE